MVLVSKKGLPREVDLVSLAKFFSDLPFLSLSTWKCHLRTLWTFVLCYIPPCYSSLSLFCTPTREASLIFCLAFQISSLFRRFLRGFREFPDILTLGLAPSKMSCSWFFVNTVANMQQVSLFVALCLLGSAFAASYNYAGMIDRCWHRTLVFVPRVVSSTRVAFVFLKLRKIFCFFVVNPSPLCRYYCHW
jgi:hypothetical protein